ncbi:DUF6344 domain-containing protein [Streptomyces seoulensis]|uniref:DUF6344 domain-containing protein n=1 Tax=Streptomyces seoulensis TaxID=73044 RepID=UPI001FCB3E90|nr:DUF6344 domain-containing protein [Streptomyces seoulensis]BDH02837.1 hypothetical protein HEK131_00640 [Streptomyces seoulensis]
MARNKVMTLWTAIVTAFLALCTALGLVTATAPAASARTESPSHGSTEHTAPTAPAATSHQVWSQARALPPTMKQRIRAEAHGKSPHCRHRALTGRETGTGTPHRVAAPDRTETTHRQESTEQYASHLDC